MLALLFACMLLAAADDADVKRVLENQRDAWSRRDIAAFMDTYERSDQTTFVGGSVTKGFDRVAENYKRGYPTREKMGRLEFSDLEVRPLCAGYAAVTGRFSLARAPDDGGDAQGIFTLLLRQGVGGWKIIHDHTTALGPVKK